MDFYNITFGICVLISATINLLLYRKNLSDAFTASDKYDNREKELQTQIQDLESQLSSMVVDLSNTSKKLQAYAVKNKQLQIDVMERDATLKENQQELLQLQDDVAKLQDSVENLLTNQETHEKVYNSMMQVVDSLYQYLLTKTRIGYFEDNWEIQELAATINRSKGQLLNCLRGNFTVENMAELTEAEIVQGEEQVAYRQIQPKEVIRVVGSTKERINEQQQPRESIVNVEPYDIDYAKYGRVKHANKQ